MSEPVRKIEYLISIPAELAEEYRDLRERLFCTPTPEDREQVRSRQAEREREQAEQLSAHEQRLQHATGLRRAVLELHGPSVEESYVYPVCHGCDADGYDVEPPEWPCRTYALARDAVSSDVS